jgi:hypothetical protein
MRTESVGIGIALPSPRSMRSLEAAPNYRMKLTRVDHRFSEGLDSPLCTGGVV